MKNYLIVTDTTSAMNGVQAKESGIELVSLSVLIDGIEYKDQIDISTEELYKKLEAYGKSDFYPFHMPGHKRNPLSVAGDFSVQQDITEINGFDNLHHPETILNRV